MRSRWSCPSALVALLLVVTAHAPAAAQSPPSLFHAPSRDGRVSAPQPRTTRARTVSVRADLLAAALDPLTAADAPFALNLFDDRTFALRRVRIDTSTAGHRTWIATSGPDDDVVAALTLGPGGLSGGITAHGVSYALQPLADGTSLIRELTAMDVPPELPAQQLPARHAPSALRRADAAAADPVRIDVLLLYTPGARTRAGGAIAIEAALANAVAVTNTALQRSAVDAALMTVGLQEVPFIESGGALTDDLMALAPGGALHDGVEALRRSAGADLVAMVVGRASPSAGCGVAYLGPAPGAIYSVTEEACLFAGQWSFAHEIGHNFGADHAPGDPIVSPVPYARGYRDAAVRTLMAYAAPGSPARSLNYSSSLVREPGVSGGPTGNSLQDNARRLAETAATVAALSGAASAPDPPANVTAVVTAGTVTLTWTPPTSGGPVQVYVVEAGPVPGSTAFGPFVTSAPAMVFPNVLPGRYYTRVRSVGSGGTSAPTADVEVDVGATCLVPGPAVVSASVASGVATLQWFAPPGTGETSYEVGLGSASGSLDLGVFAVGSRTAASLPAPPGQYFVRVRGVNGCGPGGPSVALRVVVP